MQTILEILPVGRLEWDRVKECWDAEFPVAPGQPTRSLEALKQKFQRLLHWMQIPTGDPNIPEAVKMAKIAHRDILGKAEGATGEEPVPENLAASDVEVEVEAAEERVANNPDDVVLEGDGNAVSARAEYPTRVSNPSNLSQNRKNDAYNPFFGVS